MASRNVTGLEHPPQPMTDSHSHLFEHRLGAVRRFEHLYYAHLFQRVYSLKNSFHLKTLSLCASNRCSLCTGLLIIPLFVKTLTVRIVPSFPGKVSATFPILYFPLETLSSEIKTTLFSLRGISSFVHFCQTVRLGKYSRNQRDQKWL